MNQPKIIILVCVAIAALAGVGAYVVYEQDRTAKIQEQERQDFREHLQNEHLRKIDEELTKLKWQVTMGTEYPAPVSQQKSSEYTRSYFNGVKAEMLPKVTKGMTKDEVRKMCGGRPVVPFETVQGGFTFAVNEAHTEFFTVPQWMPNMQVAYDFFIADTMILYVRYNDQGAVETTVQFPLEKRSGDRVGVQQAQTENSLSVMVGQ